MGSSISSRFASAPAGEAVPPQPAVTAAAPSTSVVDLPSGSGFSPPIVDPPSGSGFSPPIGDLPRGSGAFPPTVDTPSEKGLSNPGDYDDLGRKVREQLFPTALEGGKITIQKGLSNHFNTTHSVSLGPSPYWSYGATYVGSHEIAENDFRPVMLGEMATGGSFQGMFLHQIGPWKMKFNAQSKKYQWLGYQATGDYSGSDFSAAVTAVNPIFSDGSIIVVTQYLQALTRRLSLGTELLYHRQDGIQNAMLSLGGRYAADKWEGTARLGLHAWQLTYQHKLEENLVAMADLDGNLMQGDTCSNIGFKYEMAGGVNVQGSVSSQGTVTGAVEKTLDPVPGSLTLTAKINHWSDESKVGFMVVLG